MTEWCYCGAEADFKLMRPNQFVLLCHEHYREKHREFGGHVKIEHLTCNHGAGKNKK